jgi:hypothetical protein
MESYMANSIKLADTEVIKHKLVIQIVKSEGELKMENGNFKLMVKELQV